MEYELDGNIIFESGDFETLYPGLEHPLKFLCEPENNFLVSHEGYDADIFFDYYFNQKMICTFNKGVLDGSIEVFNDAGYLIISGGFTQGLASGNWEIFHPNEQANYSINYTWLKGKQVNPEFFDPLSLWSAEDYLPNIQMSSLLNNDTLEISHDVWGLWGNYYDEVETFKVTYKLKGKHILQREIIQYPHWEEDETLIATETFDNTGALKDVELHELVIKNDAYIRPLRFKPWVGYDDNNPAEVLMTRTIELLEAHEVKDGYEDEFHDNNNFNFGYGYKLNPDSKTYMEMSYFAWGKKFGVSMYFSEDNKINMLKWGDETIIWDNVNGIYKQNFEVNRKNIKDITLKVKPPLQRD